MGAVNWSGGLCEAVGIPVATTTRASPPRPRPRCDQATYTWLAASIAIAGRELVRNETKVSPWSNGLILASSTGFANVFPPSEEAEYIMASLWAGLVEANARQAT